MQGGTTQTSDYSFTWFEGAIKTGATVTGTGAASPGTSTYTLDPFGLVSSAATSGGSTSGTQSYVYDAASQGIARTETINGGTWMNRWTDNWYRMGGTNMWHYSNRYDPRIGDLDTSGSAYMVRSGDTVRSIAQAIWGDGDLWYKLAEANGLSATASLTEGQRLTIPQGVWRNHQTASTYIPYDAQRFLQLNDPSPAYPAPAPAKSGGDCGAFGQILLVVIAIVVVAIVAPPLIGAGGAATSTTLGVGAGALTIATPAIGTGLAGALGATAGAIVGGGIAAAAGSIVSQLVGLATGIQDKFSWKGVALAAISAGVGAGVGQIAGIAGKGIAAGAARGALGNAITQGVATATGLQPKFDWAGVAVGAVVGGTVGALGARFDQARYAAPARSFESYGQQALTGAAAAIAGASARSLITGTDFGDNVLAALPDVIGSTIGNLVARGVAIGGRISTKSAIRSLTREIVGNGEITAPDRAAERQLLREFRRAGRLDNRPERSKTYELALKDYLAAIGTTDGRLNRIDAFYEEVRSAFPVNTPGTPRIGDAVINGYDSKIPWAASPTLDRTGVWAGTIKQNVGDSIGAYLAERPGARIALNVASLGLTVLGGPIKAGLGSIYSAVEDKISTGIADQYRAAGWKADRAQLGGSGLTWVGSLVLNGAGALKAGLIAGVKVGGKVAAVPADGGVGLGPTRYVTDGDLLQSIATRADNWGARGVAGNGPIIGTYKHGYSEAMLSRYQRMFGDRGLGAEARFVNGGAWEPGMSTSGSIQLDVTRGPLTAPTHVWDYKFGGATLSPSRVTQIQNGIPNGTNVPVLEIKP